jgi:hypothetical protein
MTLSFPYRELRRDQATTFASLPPSADVRPSDRSEPLMAIDFFISYASPDAAWAEWVGWVLEDGGAPIGGHQTICSKSYAKPIGGF